MKAYTSMAARGRLGGLTTASKYDGLALTDRARQSFKESFAERARDEAAARGEEISAEEAARRGELLRRLWYARMAARSVQARKRRGGCLT
jgi:hypothetical protein